jgi:hypothetical protein
MDIHKQIMNYIVSQPEQKRSDMQDLHRIIWAINPASRLWFLDGKDESGKMVSNPNIGYGICQIKYKDGRNKDFYQVGMSANTKGISIYIFGIEDKTFLSQTYGNRIGEASISGYCIKFKKQSDIHMDVLEEIIRNILI